MRKATLVTVGTVSAVFAAGPACGQEIFSGLMQPGTLPAVSGLNWKFGLGGGYVDLDDVESTERFHVEGSFTAPLSHGTGFQVDATFGEFGDEPSGSVGGHLFARNPESYLLGLWGGYAAIGSDEIVRIGPELEFYWNSFSLEATGGWEDSQSMGEDFFARVNLAYYVTPDFRIYAGYRRSFERDVGAGGFEWLIGGPLGLPVPTSLYGEGQYGEDDHNTLFLGIRFYFGAEDKSLLRRHREDDPDDPTPELNQLNPDDECFFVSEDDALLLPCGTPPIKPL